MGESDFGGDPSGGYGDGNYGADFGAGNASLGGDLSSYGGSDFSDAAMDALGALDGYASFDPMGYGMDSMSQGVSGTYSDAAAGYGEGMGDDSWGGRLGRMALSFAKSKAAGRLGLGPIPGMIETAYASRNDKNQSRSLGSWGALGGGLLGALTGPVGAVVGAYAGSQIGQNQGRGMASYTGPGPQSEMGNGTMDLLTGAGLGLAGLYANNQNSRGINNQIGALSGMYGQGSPYAQALRQQLERRDAAGGRRSQYGPREVELQAQLAQMASRNAPGLAALYGQRAGMRNQNLAQLAGLYRAMGGYQGIRGGFNDLFGGMGGGGGIPTDFATDLAPYDYSMPEAPMYPIPEVPDFGG